MILIEGILTVFAAVGAETDLADEIRVLWSAIDQIHAAVQRIRKSSRHAISPFPPLTRFRISRTRSRQS